MESKKSQKIFFEESHHRFMNEYKETTGLSIQKFVSDAIKEKIMRLDIEQTLKDQELLNN
jgi:hypothetical protein